jgi:nicotinamide-nucleotide amidase
MLATAESCTGGLVAARLTALPGSSDVFREGFVVYSNEAKQRALGVPADVFGPRGPGAVSPECAAAMAHGALGRSGADHAVAVTGIAGPDGGTETKPVGLVCFAVAGRGREERITCRFPGDRGRVRAFATQVALDLLRRALLDLDFDTVGWRHPAPSAR